MLALIIVPAVTNMKVSIKPVLMLNVVILTLITVCANSTNSDKGWFRTSSYCLALIFVQAVTVINVSIEPVLLMNYMGLDLIIVLAVTII